MLQGNVRFMKRITLHMTLR
ncbi:hypothetical protein MTR67_039071 [Solanum verrucosum]|uniref:Uncharacterized protein n=1 Tax=Solanum verrucosum TaxID=315347 RepID=A0AAF0UHN1_SOLVR|nr:hypothetical protein MTR67_039071 [Solanum verrucosum]